MKTISEMFDEKISRKVERLLTDHNNKLGSAIENLMVHFNMSLGESKNVGGGDVIDFLTYIMGLLQERGDKALLLNLGLDIERSTKIEADYANLKQGIKNRFASTMISNIVNKTSASDDGLW